MMLPTNRRYYSLRTGKNSNTKLPLDVLRGLFTNLFLDFESRGYFQQAIGYECIDQDYVPGNLGLNVPSVVFRAIRKENLWPVPDYSYHYSEDDLFDMVEFLFDIVSKPIPRDIDYHGYGNCGYHYKLFDKEAGQNEYRAELNSILLDYENGFELSPKGEILILAETGLDLLLEAPIPSYDPENIDKRVEKAILKFRRAKSTVDERKDAIRELADVLEFMRDKAKKYMEEQDENDIFNIANNFDIRHHNVKQKTKYDNAIWYSWIFYYYLATIHALIRIIKKYEV